MRLNTPITSSEQSPSICCTHDASWNCICACHGPLPKKFFDLALELEKLPASEQQTKCVITLGELRISVVAVSTPPVASAPVETLKMIAGWLHTGANREQGLSAEICRAQELQLLEIIGSAALSPAQAAPQPIGQSDCFVCDGTGKAILYATGVRTPAAQAVAGEPKLNSSDVFGKICLDCAHNRCVIHKTREAAAPAAAPPQNSKENTEMSDTAVNPLPLRQRTVFSRDTIPTITMEPWPDSGNYSDPTPEMLKDPLWNAIWEEIKHWDINVPSQYNGYMGAIGNHATAIYKAISAAPFSPPNDIEVVSDEEFNFEHDSECPCADDTVKHSKDCRNCKCQPPSASQAEGGRKSKRGFEHAYWCCRADFGEHETDCPNYEAGAAHPVSRPEKGREQK